MLKWLKIFWQVSYTVIIPYLYFTIGKTIRPHLELLPFLVAVGCMVESYLRSMNDFWIEGRW